MGCGNLYLDFDDSYMTMFVKIIELYLSKGWMLPYINYTSISDLSKIGYREQWINGIQRNKDSYLLISIMCQASRGPGACLLVISFNRYNSPANGSLTLLIL